MLEGRPLLDVASYGRRGPGRGDRFLPEELALIGRTVRRTTEVMVKVLAKDGNNMRSGARHVNYISRRGELELETDGYGTLAIRSVPALVETDVAVRACIPELPEKAHVMWPAPQLLDSHLLKARVAPRTSIYDTCEDSNCHAEDNANYQHRRQILLLRRIRVSPLECDHYSNSGHDRHVVGALQHQLEVFPDRHGRNRT